MIFLNNVNSANPGKINTGLRRSPKIRFGLAIWVLLLIASCSSIYVKQKSSRGLYPINAEVQQDSSVIKIYLPYKQQVEAEMNAVVGTTEQALTRRSTLPESLLGNFFSDATLTEALKLYPDIDFAFTTTTGGMRADLPKGPVTLSNVFELMPFENDLLLMELKGSDVLVLLNFIAATGGQPVSGMKMNIANKQPSNIFIKGVPFDSGKNYNVLVSDYLAWGGDNTVGFQNPVKSLNTRLTVRAALLQYIKNINDQGKKINAALDGRITKD